MITVLICVLLPLTHGLVIIKVEGKTDLHFSEVTFFSSGTFEIYKARDEIDKEVTFKIAVTPNARMLLKKETKIYHQLGLYKCTETEPGQSLKSMFPEILEEGTIETGSCGSDNRIENLIGNPVIIMELTGIDLDLAFLGTISQQPEFRVNTKDWIDIAFNMVKTLGYVHSKGVVHGDIKLKNFVFSKDNKRVLLTGFDGSNECTKDLSNLHDRRLKYLSLREHLVYAMILDEGEGVNLKSNALFWPSIDGDNESLLMAIYDIQYDVPWKEPYLQFLHFRQMRQLKEARKATQDMIEFKTNFTIEIRKTFAKKHIPDTLTKLFVDGTNFSRRELDHKYRQHLSDADIVQINTNWRERWYTECERFSNMPIPPVHKNLKVTSKTSLNNSSKQHKNSKSRRTLGKITFRNLLPKCISPPKDS